MADKTTLQLHGLDGVLALLQSLPAEVVSKRGGPVKSALRKGALVVNRAEKELLARVLDPNDPDTNLLMESLVVSRGKAPSSGKGERYLARVKRQSYPDRTGKTVTTLQTAHHKEYGTEKQTATPWIRPAFQQSAENAIRTVEAETLAGIDRVVKKLSRGAAR
jgi:hypothetical protein